MVLIISEAPDQSTDLVIRWLTSNRTPFLRVDLECVPEDLQLTFSDDQDVVAEITWKGTKFSTKEVKSVWYRKGLASLCYPPVGGVKDPFMRKNIALHLRDEGKTLGDFLMMVLEKKPSIGNYALGIPNKLAVLEKAKCVGLDVPPSLVTTSRAAATSFIRQHGKVICKPLSDVFGVVHGGKHYYSHTELISIQEVDNGPATFYPSLLQKFIGKEYELRVYFFGKQFYAMAMFSTMQAETAVDFRNVDLLDNGMRMVPFSLPSEVQTKLAELMEKLGLNTGSIDLIVSPEGQYVFLEVNPCGQFGFLSEACNYQIEKSIAQYYSNGCQHEGKES